MNDLESFLKKSTEFLNRAFDVNMPASKIKFYNATEWVKVQNYLKREVDGFYDAKENIVHIPSKVSLPVFAHEFFGHALFTERSFLGRKLKEGTKDFISKIKPVSEAFSICMEKILLENCGYEHLWKEKEEILKTQNEYILFHSLISDILNKGFLSVIYELGFPKSKRRDVLHRFAGENLKNWSDIKYLIFYGSGQRDLDMLAVYSSDIPRGHVFYQNAADIIILGEKEFKTKLNLLDVELINPVLTGTRLHGPEKEYNQLIQKLVRTPVKQETIQYARRRSHQTLNSARLWMAKHEHYLEELAYQTNEQIIAETPVQNINSKLVQSTNFNAPSENLLYCLSNLTYTMSYILSIRKQSNGGNIILLDELKQNQVFNEVYTYRKDVEHNRQELTAQKIKNYINCINQAFHVE